MRALILTIYKLNLLTMKNLNLTHKPVMNYKALITKALTLMLATFLTLSCNFSKKKQENSSSEKEELIVTRQMGEFEKIESLRLIWPTYDNKKGEPVESVTLAIIDELVSDLRIVISCADDETLKTVKSKLSEKYPDLKNLSFCVIPSTEMWTRDIGPMFVETNDGKHAIADFNLNSWGYPRSPNYLDSNTIHESYDENAAKLLNIPVISTTMVSEGGNREVNGKGTLMVTETVAQGRNPKMTKAEMETEYKRLLGVKKIIWLKEGLVEDDHTFRGQKTLADGTKAYTVLPTNGHVDEFARFVGNSTIVIASIDPNELEDPIAKENYRRMEENFKILSESTDQDGNPFRVIRVPMPPQTILNTMSPGDGAYEIIKQFDYEDGSKFPDGETVTVLVPASYLNFIITNKVVIGQKYWREGMSEKIKATDAGAKQILQEAFPNRKVVMLDVLPVNLGGGGIHCISMHQPELKK